LSPATGTMEDEANGTWRVQLGSEVSDTGSYPIRAEVDCAYRHVQLVDAEGNPLSGEGGQVIVGHVRILPPAAGPPLLVALGLGVLWFLYRLWRRRVPGQLMVGTASDTVFGNQRRPQPLGRRRHR